MTASSLDSEPLVLRRGTMAGPEGVIDVAASPSLVSNPYVLGGSAIGFSVIVAIAALAGAASWLTAGGAILAALCAAAAMRLGVTDRNAMEAIGSVCRSVRDGDFEKRLLHVDRSYTQRDTMLAVNGLIDVIDAFVRESGAAMRYVAAGKYYRPIALRGLRGQFERQASVINTAVASLDERVRELRETTEALKSGVLRIMNDLANSSQALSGTATRLNESIGAASGEAEAAATATDGAAASAETIAAAAEELSNSSQSIARIVDETARAAGRAQADSQSATAAIATLADSVTAIGEVSQLISEIASQTNLLALNATIESARAGEAGKGFAVVAGEVKALAGQTAQATHRITERVLQIRAQMEQARQAITLIADGVESVNSFMSEVRGAVGQQADATGEIARAALDASGAAATVAGNVAVVRDSALSTREITAEAVAAVRGVAGSADALRAELERFFKHTDRMV